MIGRWREDATGKFGWPPSQFWRCRLADFIGAVEGWNRAQTGGSEPMTREHLEELEAEYGASTPSIRKSAHAD